MRTLVAAVVGLALLLYSSRVSAQGMMHGSVVDSLTMDYLKGAEVTLEGTTFNAVSNTDGEFRISGVPPGEYMLQVSYLGYREKQYLIKIESESTLSLLVELLPIGATENGPKMTQQARDLAQEINQEIRANTIKNVVSGGMLQGLPDENIPIALSRLPGVSIMNKPIPQVFAFDGVVATRDDGILSLQNYPFGFFSLDNDQVSRVYIRGLDSKYSNITFDGIRLSPTSPIDKGIDLGIIPVEDLQNIEVRKTITSDEDGDATAGAINLVTGKAPSKRIVQAELLGNYNKLDESADQYDFDGAYGERYFENALGVRANVHAEKRIMSNEYQNVSNVGSFLPDDRISYTNATKQRNGGSILVDFMTPDGSSIEFNNIFYKTNTSSLESGADTTGGLGTYLIFRDSRAEQRVFLSSLGGSTFLFGLDVDWSAAFSESQADHPLDYSLQFNGAPVGLGITYPDFVALSLESPWRNYSKEKTASIDIDKKYMLGDEIAGEMRIGGKYRINSRSYDDHLHVQSDRYQYVKLADGTLVEKDYSGTRFDSLVGKSVHLSDFQDAPADQRVLFGQYGMPLISEDAMLLWRQLNYSPYYSNDGPHVDSYNLSESVTAVYAMHKLDFGQWARFITGLRIESEHNNSFGYYFPYLFNIDDPSKFYNALPQQTNTFHHNEVALLPNFQMILRPTHFLNLRLATYETLIRPDYNARMPKYFSLVDDFVGPSLYCLQMGNPDLKNADVWNYEFETQFYGNGIGQISINAFYKNIKGMVQAIDGVRLAGASTLDSLGINWRDYTSKFPFPNGSQYLLYSYFNSLKPTRIWGFEIEHQANFRYLPGLLENIVLNYNFTFLRSEIWVEDAKWIYTTTPQSILTNTKGKISDMPEFIANVALGYDIKGFSFRISYFYQDGYPMYSNYFGADDITQIKENRFSRLDIAVRQQILRNFSVIVRANNVTDSEERALAKWSPSSPWQTSQAYRMGPNYDFGVGINL